MGGVRNPRPGSGAVGLRRAFTASTMVATSCWIGVLFAQSGGSYDIRRATIDGGGGRSSGGTLQVTGTVGQPDVGRSSGQGFVSRGGFWAGPAAQATAVILFVDGFE